MTVYRLKSKLFYTKGENRSFNKGKQIGFNNAQRQFQKRIQELENQNKSLQQKQNQGIGGGGIALGAVGGAAGTIGLGVYQARKAEMNQQPQMIEDQTQYYQ